MGLTLDITGIQDFVNLDQEKNFFIPEIQKIHHSIHHQPPQSNLFDCLYLPFCYDPREIQRIKLLRKKNDHLEILVVIGIGGSYLGAKAGIEFLKTPFDKNKTQIIFAGQHLSSLYLSQLIIYLKGKNWALNVISKSGDTLETTLFFSVLKKELEIHFGKKSAQQKIFITTNDHSGFLYQLALKEGYEKFRIPEYIGGRFSVLTAVGFLPLAFADHNIEKILQGAQDAFLNLNTADFHQNIAYQYALIRFLCYRKKMKTIELLVNYEPNLIYLAEWWKQLFAESEGKNHQSLFPCSLNCTTDLHSLGQYIQEGPRLFLETILNVRKPQKDYFIDKTTYNADPYNYLGGLSVFELNKKISKAVKQAHIQGQVPTMELIFDQFDEYHFGYLVYFFQKACIVSASLLKVNPFDQPGVTVYKEKMWSLFNKK